MRHVWRDRGTDVRCLSALLEHVGHRMHVYLITTTLGHAPFVVVARSEEQAWELVNVTLNALGFNISAASDATLSEVPLHIGAVFATGKTGLENDRHPSEVLQ